MKTRNLFTLVCVFVLLNLLVMLHNVCALDGWTQDVAKAMEQAKAEKKGLLLNFTGSDWCVWCKKLEGEVFSKKEFVDEAQKDFILVTLDFPSDQSKVPEEIQRQNAQWKTKFGVSGFPTVYLADASGRPYAKTGYQEGGPQAYLPHIKEKRTVQTNFETALAKAAEAEGVERAKLLDEALALLDEDLIESHYADIVKEIVALDADDAAGLRGKWNGAQDEEDRREILARIGYVQRTQPPKVVLSVIEDALAKYRFPIETKLDVLEVKLKMLNATGGQAEAVALLDELIADQRIDEETRERLRVRMIYSLVKTGNESKALEMLDDLMIQYKENRHKFLFSKGELLHRLDRHDQAVESYDLAIAASADSDFRHEVKLAKADSLASSKKVDEALALLDQAIDDAKTTGYLLSDTWLRKAMILRDFDRIADAETAEQQAIDAADTPAEQAAMKKLVEQLRREKNGDR